MYADAELQAVERRQAYVGAVTIVLAEEVQHELEMVHRCLAMASHWQDRAHEHYERLRERADLFAKAAALEAAVRR
jgi:hypothetical protein